ncbi:MAG: TraR/DksA C4-type zinc finger protein [Steroidobacteraceae bacterium]
MDVNQAEIARDVQELREIERAQERIAEGTYGRCTECGEAITRARLEANPSAQRCIRCQEAVENDGRNARPVSL